MAADEKPLLTFEIVTLFPEMFDGFLRGSLLGKAIAAGLIAAHRTNPRDHAPGRHRSTDDTPYGGGPGMILRVEPLAGALDAIVEARGPAHRILLTPQGKLFDQRRARELAALPRVALVCGRYEGVDERVGARLCDEQLSIGDYVLAGGEVAAAVIIEALARLCPGVMGCGSSATDESFSENRLEYPQWTRPEEWQGLAVPKVLLSGDHQAVARWRRREALKRTRERRPDLLAAHPLTEEEQHLLAEEKD
ncbi:MAG TPA: tRNA (guanosine(37)-N1)-methyltransferase TrmD [Polyangia bacterium]|jgi:tRNA (guanine37-N1)-methyltransferase|nr:tRNA (guanosine(37)-N1)-methyltransferase TrmD [Polyangia bacterium]